MFFSLFLKYIIIYNIYIFLQYFVHVVFNSLVTLYYYIRMDADIS